MSGFLDKHVAKPFSSVTKSFLSTVVVNIFFQQTICVLFLFLKINVTYSCIHNAPLLIYIILCAMLFQIMQSSEYFS